MEVARHLTSLPEHLHHRGEPTEWVRMTRPGQHLHSFLEGLAIAPDGTLFVADVPYGRIFRINPDRQEWFEIVRYAGQPHGLMLSNNGQILASYYGKGILRLDLTTHEIATVCQQYNGSSFKGLSDLTIDSDANIWFTDPGRSSLSDPTGRLFRLSPAGEIDCILDDIPYPNGIAISPDGMFVYIAVTRANAVWRLLRISPERTPMAGIYIQLSGGLGPDGLAISKRGELAVAQAQAGRVYLFDKLGDEIARIETPGGRWTTSVRFGGRDDDKLYIAEAETGSIFEWSL